MPDTVTIDGSRGEGGGQILRSALALSLATGRAFHLERIRAGRKKPGLLGQHVACVRLAARIGDAAVEGGEQGSTTLAFSPQSCRAGTYEVKVGTAGSTSLVVQSVLPALMFAEGPSELVVEGGTHAMQAPPFEFLRDAWMPLLERMGARIDAQMERAGFFPAGGGRLRVRIEPVAGPAPLDLRARGRQRDVRATAHVAGIPAHVAERELTVVSKRLGWKRRDLRTLEHTDTAGPGNALVLRVAHEHVTEVFASFGARGVPAERVARNACAQVDRWVRAEAPVGPHLADQLMLPMALGAGGVYRTADVTQHSQTNIEILSLFLGETIELQPVEGGGIDVRVAARG